MNSVHNLTVGKANYKLDTIPINDLFVNHENEIPQKKSKKIENLIETYSLEYKNFILGHKKSKGDTYSDWLLLRADYEDLLEDLKRTTMPDKYVGLMSWLINRCFAMTPDIVRNRNKIQSKLSKNRPLLLKILYDLNPKMFLKCFKKE